MLRSGLLRLLVILAADVFADMKKRLFGRHFVYSTATRDALHNILPILAAHAVAGTKTQPVGRHFVYRSPSRDRLHDILLLAAPNAASGMKTQLQIVRRHHLHRIFFVLAIVANRAL